LHYDRIKMKTWKLNSTGFFIAVLLFISVGLKGQEMLGLNFTNYSGIYPSFLNPALMTGSRVFVDLNLFGVNSTFSNDAIYFSANSKVIRNIVFYNPDNFKNGEFNWGRTYNYYDNTNNKYISANVKVVGPSVMIQNDRHAFALTTAFRSMHSGNQIPYEVPVFFYQGLSFKQLQNIEYDDYDFGVVSMSWSELAFSYAYDVYRLYGNKFTIGVTAKGLLGYQGGYVAMNNVNYIVHDETTVDFRNLNAEIGYSLPIGYGTELESDYSPLIKGYGVGADIGFVYTKLKSTHYYDGDEKLCAKPYNDYLFKIGLSILDLGSIGFKSDAQKHEFENVSKYWEDFDTTHFYGIEYATQVYSEVFYGDPDASLTGDAIRVGLPTAISLQFDYHLKRTLYLSALWVQPIKTNLRTLWRPPQLAVVPRYENKYFGVSLPVSLYNYKEVRMGLSLRLYYLTIGTDRLGSWLGVSNWSGTDIYFSFRFTLQKGKCSSYGRGACSNSKFGNEW